MTVKLSVCVSCSVCSQVHLLCVASGHPLTSALVVPYAPGVAYDTDTAHMWLGRVVRGVLRVEGLGVLPLEGGAERRAGGRAAAAGAPGAAPPGWKGGAALGSEGGSETGAAPQRTHAALLQQVCAPGPRYVHWGG